ncbi:MAG: Asd/ArgC dimerization domain-containing protein, partial [Thermoanaerobaculia bacterium]|nr:Asd/ArgC dimerization domain-containing protein [Thermoanaerobaculia bacterium]
ADEPVIVRPADESEFDGLDFVFFCGNAEENARWIDLRSDHGFIAVDLTQPSNQLSSGLMSIADLNSETIEEETDLIISPHPVTTALALVLAPIADKVPIELCTATVLLPASEMDQRGIDEMFEQTVAVLNVQSPPHDVFDRQVAFNLYPDPGASGIEEYVSSQLDHLFDDRVPVSVQFLRGGTFHSYSISLHLQVDGDLLEEELAALLSESYPLTVAELEESFSTVDAGGLDEILVGRVRSDPAIEGGFWLFAVADNLRRISALNAVLLAEHLVERFGLAPN